MHDLRGVGSISSCNAGGAAPADALAPATQDRRRRSVFQFDVVSGFTRTCAFAKA
jgi:hypothetical protein